MDSLTSSRYNQVTKIDNNNYAIFNPLSGAFDIADDASYKAFERGLARNEEEQKYWLERGYFFKNKSEEKIYIAKRYQDFLNVSEENEIQFILVLNYACNFNCSYCYQKGIDINHKNMSEEMLAAFIKYIVQYKEKNNKKITVTLFGGEPLLNNDKQKKLIEFLVDNLSKNDITMSVVTNGYYLEQYLPILEKVRIKELHVSIDGAQEEHDKRRSPKDGKGSYKQIMNGLVIAKNKKIPINIRLITDKKTIQTFPKLASDLQERGFFGLEKGQFKASLGRNYELIDESMTQDDLFDLDQMYQAYTDLLKQHPILEKLHIPSYFGITKMLDSGEMFVPSFDTCPAGKSEFVFDNSGKIFGCTASCGRDNYELGTFYPELKFDEIALKEWQTRNILNIEQCRDCSVGIVCGGGCGVIAKDRNGKVHSPNCKPIKNVMDIGINFYKEKILQKVNNI
jgi:uncharacterized protein